MSKELEALYRLATRNNGSRRSDEEVDNDFKIVEKALKKYESIDNANPSKALECLKCLINFIDGHCGKTTYEDDVRLIEVIDTIEQALLQQEHNYLKWEDLEFDNNAQIKKYLKVKLGDNIYNAYYHFSFLMGKELFCIENDKEGLNIVVTDKQFFDNLHLERVEE